MVAPGGHRFAEGPDLLGRPAVRPVRGDEVVISGPVPGAWISTKSVTSKPVSRNSRNHPEIGRLNSIPPGSIHRVPPVEAVQVEVVALQAFA